MSETEIESGILVSLEDIHPSSPYFKHGISIRVTGRLQDYTEKTNTAVLVDGSSELKINTQHIRGIDFRVGSIYQFIGDLFIETDNEATLLARLGRNVDGIDLSLYHQTLQLLRRFQADLLKNPST